MSLQGRGFRGLVQNAPTAPSVEAAYLRWLVGLSAYDRS